jgi:hypothetical protein
VPPDEPQGFQVLAAQGAALGKALRKRSEVDRFGVQVRDRFLVEGLGADAPRDFGGERGVGRGVGRASRTYVPRPGPSARTSEQALVA